MSTAKTSQRKQEIQTEYQLRAIRRDKLRSKLNKMKLPNLLTIYDMAENFDPFCLMSYLPEIGKLKSQAQVDAFMAGVVGAIEALGDELLPNQSRRNPSQSSAKKENASSWDENQSYPVYLEEYDILISKHTSGELLISRDSINWHKLFSKE